MKFFIGMVLLVLGTMFLTVRVHAHMFDVDDCISLSNDAVTFAERHRASPNTLEHDELILSMVLSEKMGSPDSYIKDENDKKEVLKLFSDVAEANWTPGQAYDHEYEQCMKKAAPTLPKGEKQSGKQIES